MGLIGGSNKKTTQNINNNINTLDLQDAEVGGAVIADVNGDVNILDAGAILAANNLSQAALTANTDVTGRVLDANTSVVDGAFGAFSDVLDTLGGALQGSTQLVGSITRASNQQVANVIDRAAAASRSDASNNIDTLTRYGAITVGIVAAVFVFRGRK